MDGYDFFIQIVQWALLAIGGYILITGGIRFFQSFGETGTGADRQQGGLTALGGLGIIGLGVAVAFLIPKPSFAVLLVVPLQMLLG